MVINGYLMMSSLLKSPVHSLVCIPLLLIIITITVVVSMYVHVQSSCLVWAIGNFSKFPTHSAESVFFINIIYILTPDTWWLSLDIVWEKISPNLQDLSQYPSWLLYFIYLLVYTWWLVVMRWSESKSL